MKIISTVAMLLTAAVLSQESIEPISAEIPTDEVVPTDTVMVATSGAADVKFLAYLDTAAGAFTGFYVPFSNWVRNDDCFSNFVKLADTIVDYHVPFDGEGIPSGLLKQILFGMSVVAPLTMELYGTYNVCVDQY